MAKNFPNLEKEADIQMQEVQRVPTKKDDSKENHTKTHYN